MRPSQHQQVRGLTHLRVPVPVHVYCSLHAPSALPPSFVCPTRSLCACTLALRLHLLFSCPPSPFCALCAFLWWCLPCSREAWACTLNAISDTLCGVGVPVSLVDPAGAAAITCLFARVEFVQPHQPPHTFGPLGFLCSTPAYPLSPHSLVVPDVSSLSDLSTRVLGCDRGLLCLCCVQGLGGQDWRHLPRNLLHNTSRAVCSLRLL